MKTKLATLAIACFFLLAGHGAHAGQHQDALAKCLVKSTTQSDRDALVRWIFIAMASHPLTHDLASVPAARRAEVTRQASGVFEKLMTETCGTETLNTIKFEGTEAFGKAFETLGSVAMDGLISDPNVNRTISEMAEGLDQRKFEELMRKHNP